MVKKVSVLFLVRKDKIDKSGNLPIYCRITLDSSRASFSINRSLPLAKWNSSKGLAKGSSDEISEVNSHINSIRTSIYETLNKLEQENISCNAELLRDTATGKTRVGKSKCVFELFEDHNSRMAELSGRDFAPATVLRYGTTLMHLRGFVKHRYNRSTFQIAEINNEFIHDLDHYFRTVRKCNNNSTVKYIKNFKKVIRIALSNGWLLKDPFLNYKVKIEKTDRGYLTQVELDKLINKDFDIKRLTVVKDIFVFQCFTGLAYCDTIKLTKENIIEDENSVKWISTFRTKTKVPVSIPLMPEALKILAKYEDRRETDNLTSLFPVISNQRMNSYLKEIADLCGINKRCSVHLSRHTFSTTVTLSKGVSIEVVSKMLGHTNLSTTQIYARVLNERVLREMNKLISNLK